MSLHWRVDQQTSLGTQTETTWHQSEAEADAHAAALKLAKVAYVIAWYDTWGVAS